MRGAQSYFEIVPDIRKAAFVLLQIFKGVPYCALNTTLNPLLWYFGGSLQKIWFLRISQTYPFLATPPAAPERFLRRFLFRMQQPSTPFPELSFLKPGSPASAEELHELEQRLGFPLPPSLRAWLELHNDAMLGRANYWIPMEKIVGLPCSVGVEYLMSVAEIHEALDVLDLAFPPGHVPFGHDGSGNYLLLAPEGAVCFWDWSIRVDPDAPGAVDDCTLTIAGSLAEFLTMLEAGPLAEME